MNNETLSYILALSATLCFSTSSLVFAEYSKRVSVLWMNTFKALIALIALVITIPLFASWHLPAPWAVAGFMLSGFIGLNIGDLFLLRAFTHIGVSRTLILFGFQPLLIGVGAYLLFDQPLNPTRFIAVVFLILCLFTFSYERYKIEKRWELKGLLFALAGVSLDACGVLITRASFGMGSEITPIESHFYRCLGALIGFAVIAKWQPIHLLQGFRQWSPKIKTLIVAAALGGTYLSLLLYLTAIQIGHLASLAGIAITGPMFAAALESVLHRKAPSRYLMVAFGFFCIGFYILLVIT